LEQIAATGWPLCRGHAASSRFEIWLDRFRSRGGAFAGLLYPAGHARPKARGFVGNVLSRPLGRLVAGGSVGLHLSHAPRIADNGTTYEWQVSGCDKLGLGARRVLQQCRPSRCDQILRPAWARCQCEGIRPYGPLSRNRGRNLLFRNGRLLRSVISSTPRNNLSLNPSRRASNRARAN